MIATAVRIRHNTTAGQAAFVGLDAEITVDTDKHTVVVHDGATPGGHPLATRAELDAEIDGLAAPDLSSYAPLASPTFTGTPAAPTPSPNDNSTKLATTAYADAIKTALINGAGSGADTFGEVETTLGLKAPLASPTFTGTPAGPTAAGGTNTTQLATTAFVKAAIDVVLGGVSASFDTLSEIATQLGLLAPLASPTFTGNPTAPTQSAGNNSTRLATTAYVDTADALKANLASPTLTGTPAAPTAAAGTNTTQIATTAFITGAIATAAQWLANTAGKFLTTDQVWSAAAAVALIDAATIAVDMGTFINASVTIAGNRTLGQPSNTKNGQSGIIRIKQDGTGSKTLAYHADWEFAGAVAPVLSTTANAEDLLFYQVLAANRIFGSLIKAVS